MRYEQARNVVVQLQAEPLDYRNFGVYWWHVKDELKRHGFTQDNLQHLGGFTDPQAARYYAGLEPDELTSRAFELQADGAFVVAQSQWGYTPDGDVYFLLDEDVE